MAAEFPIHKRRVNPGLSPLPGPVPISRLVLPDHNPLLDDATLVGTFGLIPVSTRTARPPLSPPTVSTSGPFVAGWVTSTPTRRCPRCKGMHVKAFLLAEAARGIAPATRSSALFVLRSFYEYLRSEELLEANATATITVPGARKLRTEVYTDTEADLILAWAANQPKRRWRFGYVVLATLRWTQPTPQRDRHTGPRPGGPRRPAHLRQGDNARVVPIAPPRGAHPRRLSDHRALHPPDVGVLLHHPSSHHGERYEGRVGPMRVAKAVKAAGTGTGVSGRHFPHRWRHSNATSLLWRRADIHVVQRLLANSNIATTTRYLHLSDADLSDAVDRAFPAESATPPAASRGRRRGAARAPPGRHGPSR
jgi:site-specific recombinase XerC